MPYRMQEPPAETAERRQSNELTELQQIYRMMRTANEQVNTWIRGLFPRLLISTVLSIAVRHEFEVACWGDERGSYRWVAVRLNKVGVNCG